VFDPPCIIENNYRLKLIETDQTHSFSVDNNRLHYSLGAYLIIKQSHDMWMSDSPIIMEF
jgi:hypothetical protein